MGMSQIKDTSAANKTTSHSTKEAPPKVGEAAARVNQSKPAVKRGESHHEDHVHVEAAKDDHHLGWLSHLSGFGTDSHVDKADKAPKSCPVPSDAARHIQAIAATEENLDEGNRNKQITGEYARQAEDMRDFLGPDAGASWVNYAAFASNQVGKGIRGEEGWGPFSPNEGQRRALSDGNHDVFAEISPKFQSFIDEFGQDQARDPEKLKEWLDASFEAGDDPTRGGQDRLRSAFENYYNAKWETDPQKKQENVTLANIQIAEHEQIRLDSKLDKALADPGGVNGVLKDVGDFFSGGGVDEKINDLVHFDLPGGSLKIDEDVPSSNDPNNHLLDFNKIKNPELKAIIDKWRETGSKSNDSNSLDGTDAKPWHDLDERMYFLAQLMRVQGTNPMLFDFSQLNTGDSGASGGGGGSW